MTARSRRGARRTAQRSHTTRKTHTRPWTASWVAIGAAIGLLLLAGWWATTAMTGDDTPVPIATLDTPDYHALLISADDPDRVLFGSHAGIMESTDSGRSWARGSLRDQDAMQLTSSPAAPATIYATGHDVFKVSHDGGATWQTPDHNLPGIDIHGFTQLPDAPERLFAFVVGFGVLTSPDGGANWTSIDAQPPGSGAHVVLTASDSALYASTDSGIVRSADGGSTWEPLASSPDATVISLAAVSGEPDTLIAGTPVGLMRSTDGSASWQELGPAKAPVLALAVTPGQPDRILLVNDKGEIYSTDDGGDTWAS